MTTHTAELDICDLKSPLDPGTTLIEASAGTGKTYTLAALFLRLILEQGLDVGQILVTTFTIPATAELRDRIRTLLRDAHEAFAKGSKDPFLTAVVARFGNEAVAMRKRLEQALHSFDEAAIHTIHSFCQRILKDRAFESGASFDQEFLADEGEIIREVAEDFWRQQFYGCEVCLVAAAIAKGLDPQEFASELRKRLNHPKAKIIPSLADYDPQEIRRRIPQLVSQLSEIWQRQAAEVERHFQEDNGWAKGDCAKTALMRGHLDNVHATLSDLDNLPGFQSLFMFARSVIEANTRAKKTAPAIEFFDICDELNRLCDQYVMALRLEFLTWAPTELARRKTRQNVLSFNDLLTRLHDGLHGEGGEALATSIRSRFKAALIDEFQDTDPLQDKIFERIFADGQSWLFLIGDPKQAIYGFRSADVFTYLNAADRANRRFTLGTNFRSASALVAATNHLFQRPQPDRSFIIDRIQFHPVKPCGKKEDERFTGDNITAPLRIWAYPPDTSPNKAATEDLIVNSVTAEIVSLLRGNTKLGDRPVVPADIAVLTRTNADALKMLASLQGAGIPGIVLSSANVFLSPEARELLAVLSAVVHPRDESRIRAALLTDILGMTSTELFALSDDETEWEAKLEQFARWHELWITKGFIQMFRQLLLDTDFRARALVRQDGERKLTNLLHISELLQQAVAEDDLSPDALLKLLARQISEKGDTRQEEMEMRLERDDEAVRIVTVHKSKGLEYNIVFCPFLWNRNDKHNASGVRFHDPAHDWQLTYDMGTDEAVQHQQLATEEDLAEQARLVYVALTRAKQRCDIAWGRFNGYHNTAAAWLIHGPDAPPGPAAPILADQVKPLSPEDWRASLENLAATSNGSIEIVDPPEPSRARAPHRGEPLVAGEPRRFAGAIESDWSVSSFTSLSEHYESETPDHDSHAEPIAELDEKEPEGIHAFPAGARAGVCLHEILENLDFKGRTNLASLVKQKLPAHSFDLKQWEAPVTACMERMLDVPLAPGFTFGDIGKKEQLPELEFYLPARRLEAGSLSALLASEAERLEFAPRRGWLKGFIDLVFRHNGRYYLADWKSNRLGTHAAAYTQPTLNAAMISHHYPLQYHLYTVALHRYLRRRIPGYRYQEHFGGVFYVFMRGVDPTRPDLGIVHRRPKETTIEGLDAWLNGTR